VSNVKTALAFRTKKQRPGVPIDEMVLEEPIND
jgi:hypothetical protein